LSSFNGNASIGGTLTAGTVSITGDGSLGSIAGATVTVGGLSTVGSVSSGSLLPLRR
jgi:hypothetical protein